MKRPRLPAALIAALLAGLSSCTRDAPYGLTTRGETKPYLGMPANADSEMPKLRSQTGVFRDTAQRIASTGLLPYDLNVAFWSDGADKARWISVPTGRIGFSATG